MILLRYVHIVSKRDTVAEFEFEMLTLVVESIPQKRGSQGRISPKSNCLSSIHQQTDRGEKIFVNTRLFLLQTYHKYTMIDREIILCRYGEVDGF